MNIRLGLAFALLAVAAATSGACGAVPNTSNASGQPAQPLPAVPKTTPPRAFIRVTLATLWTQPGILRSIDQPSATRPVDIPRWLRSMTTDDRRWLVGRIVTQASYGVQVAVLGHRGAWTKVAVRGQATPLNRYGYPGWLPTVQLTTDVSEQLSPSRLRLDLNARIDLGARNEAYVGLYDLGQNTRLTLQAGNKLDNSLTARYGLYASKIGGGLDFQANPYTQLRADLWDTNRVRLDVRSAFRVNNNASIWIGADELNRRPIPILGVQLKN